MKFLVVLVCVTANYFWQQDLDRFDDSWFFKLRGWLESKVAARLPRLANAWLVSMLLVFGIPLVVLGVLLALIDGVAFGLFTIAIHIFVLLFAMDRTQPGMLAQRYQELWRAGDYEACYLYLQEHLAGESDSAADDIRALHERFGRLFTYRCFERMFVMIFWYMIGGPLAILFVYTCYQYRGSRSPAAVPATDQTIHILLYILEWLPLRLLGLTFCLVGDFESCFGRFKAMFFSTEQRVDQQVHHLATGALSLDSDLAGAERADPGQRGPGSFVELAAMENDALQALLERSQIIWLCGLAIAAVFGFGA